MFERGETASFRTAVLLACSASLLLAALPASLADTPAAPRPIYILVWGGLVSAEDQPGELQNADTGLAASVGVGHRLGRRVTGEFELLLAFRNYDTPSGITFATEELNVGSTTALYSVRMQLGSGRVKPFVGGGAGLSYAKLDVPSSLVPFASRLRDEDAGFAYQLTGGVEIALDKTDTRRLIIELRELDCEFDFDELSSDKTEAGGVAYLIGYRRRL
jgi:opacity protein-like surface antigen